MHVPIFKKSVHVVSLYTVTVKLKIIYI